MDTKHQSVLLQETVDGLAVKDGDVVVDCTLGAGGHSYAVLEQASSQDFKSLTLIGLDADKEAIERSKEYLASFGRYRLLFKEMYNHNLNLALEEFGIEEADKYVFDLGLSSYQLDADSRGFSFQKDEPLVMTFKQDPDATDLTAHEIVNTWSEDTLREIIKGYGEERFAGKIAKEIVRSRKEKKIDTTKEFVEVIRSAVPLGYQKQRIHFATRTFQAIRIATNNELENLKVALDKAWQHLRVGGRIAVISFHSLEDRVAKRKFKEFEFLGGKKVNKKPIVPTREEVRGNPRSRSAKLRIIQKYEH